MTQTSDERRATLALLACAAAVLLVAADAPKSPQSDPAVVADPEVARALRESWPDHPEWVDMLVDILQDAPMDANYGWFRTALTQTRFGWDATRNRFDRDGDGSISRNEFPGPDADFARLDHDRDAVLTAADFDFSQRPAATSPGAVVFTRADRDGNGRVTKEEFDALFRSLDSGDRGFLSQYDLTEALNAPPRAPSASGGQGWPSKSTLVRGLFSQEIGSLQPGPKLDETAPDFTLKTKDGKDEVTLSKLIGPKPVVLVFGNVTCGPFRGQAVNLEKLYHRYKDRATFVMVYVREAHPTDGWRMESNDRAGVSTRQPRSYEERVEVARTCARSVGLSFPMLVDRIDDRTGSVYSGMPGRFYLIDRAGKIAFKNGRGPFGFKPAELETSLVLLLRQEETASTADMPASDRPNAGGATKAAVPRVSSDKSQ